MAQTRATQALDKAGISYELRTYTYDPSADRIGVHAAESMGVPPDQVLKTLIAYVDGKPVCVLVPSDREVNMKKLAQAFGAKSAEMSRPADAERLTGYHVGRHQPVRSETPPADSDRPISLSLRSRLSQRRPARATDLHDPAGDRHRHGGEDC